MYVLHKSVIININILIEALEVQLRDVKCIVHKTWHLCTAWNKQNLLNNGKDLCEWNSSILFKWSGKRIGNCIVISFPHQNFHFYVFSLIVFSKKTQTSTVFIALSDTFHPLKLMIALLFLFMCSLNESYTWQWNIISSLCYAPRQLCLVLIGAVWNENSCFVCCSWYRII